jgi:aryl-alcohol dehydrogenase-like predicted oxidoreductase
MKIALGCMGMSGMYGTSDEAESIATIHAALDAGVTLLDTGDFYGMGDNEMLIGRAIKGRKAQLSVKFGLQRGPDGAILGYDTRPAAMKTSLAYSLKRLGVESIEIYRPSRLDPAVPIEDTIGAIAEMVKAGYVRRIGLSEVGVETIRRAARVHPIVDLQIEYSIASRKPEQAIFPTLREMDIGATLYGVYSRGLLTGSKPQGKSDFRAILPRFTENNVAAVDAVAAFAKQRGITQGQTLLGWVMAKQPGFIPVVGARTRAQLSDALATKPLSGEDVEALERAFPAVRGSRYAESQMRHLDSER